VAKRCPEDCDLRAHLSFIFHAASHIKSILQTGLFSAAVSVLLAVTIPDLKQDPQDKSAFYLENMYKLQVLADSNGSRASTPAQPSPFSAPNYAIWVNSLWILSLSINLAVGMLATLQQQWASRYIKITRNMHINPHDRARMLYVTANGIDNSWLSGAIETSITLMHISLFLFFSGLLIYLFNINRAVFGAVVWCIVVFALRFLWITVTSRFVFKTSFPRSLTKISGNTAWKIDRRVLKRIFTEVQAEDGELYRFFQNIPDFCCSTIIKEPRRIIHSLGKSALSSALIGFLERTWTSNPLSDSDKMQRLVVCVKVADAVLLPEVALSILKDIFPSDRHKALRSVEMGESLRRQGNTTQQKIGLCAQSIVAGIISNVQGSDDRWIALAADQLGKSKEVIRSYVGRGNDNVLLANLIYITQQILASLEDDLFQRMNDASSYILPSLSNFDIQNTSPELQFDFQALWHEIVRKAPNNRIAWRIHDQLLTLHNTVIQVQGTNEAPAAPLGPPEFNPQGYPLTRRLTRTFTQATAPFSSFRQDTRPATSPPRSLLPVSGHSTPNPADQSLPGGSQYEASPATATSGNKIVDPSSREKSTLGPYLTVPSYFPGRIVESPLSASTSLPSPAHSRTASILAPNVASPVPLGAHDNARGLSDPSQIVPPHDINLLDPSAEKCDPSASPA
jgi:Family of unknown function (DUF6535)